MEHYLCRYLGLADQGVVYLSTCRRVRYSAAGRCFNVDFDSVESPPRFRSMKRAAAVHVTRVWAVSPIARELQLRGEYLFSFKLWYGSASELAFDIFATG